jgi:hypothetical protein
MGVILFGGVPGRRSMHLARYFLLSSGKEWLVTLEGRVIGRYPSRTEATEAAVVMADLMGAMHYDADVVIESEPDGALELIWVYGEDLLPRPVGPRIPDKAAPRHHVRLVQRGEAA